MGRFQSFLETLTELIVPEMTGLELLERIGNFDPVIEVIRKGISDYLNEPISAAALRERFQAMLEEVRRRRQRELALQEELSAHCGCMVGNSPAMQELFSRIRWIAPHFRTVLVTGPTGSGKELVTQALHGLSPTPSGNLVVLNCSALVENLFESEMFGHVKGSFTGAARDKVGLVERASGGTLLLDEIGDMSPGNQAKLLRTIQNQEVQRVGSLQIRKVNVRVIAATHRDLRAMMREGRFREDLYYRLSMVELRVPSLAERKEDLPLLARYFIEKFSRQFDKPVRGMRLRASMVLSRHDWPGNVRELENAMGHACMMVPADTIDVADLPAYLSSGLSSSALSRFGSTERLASPDGRSAASVLENAERRLVWDALARASGNESEAARQLRIGRNALRYKTKKYALASALPRDSHGGESGRKATSGRRE